MYKYYNTAANFIQLTRVCNFINRRLCLANIIKTRFNGANFTRVLPFNPNKIEKSADCGGGRFFADGYFIDGINQLIKTFTRKFLKIR